MPPPRPLTKNIKRLQKRANRMQQQMHLVGPTQISPAAKQLEAGPRGICQWCRASIPIEMTPLPLSSLVRSSTRDTHRITGWCSLCGVWGIDVTVDVGRIR